MEEYFLQKDMPIQDIQSSLILVKIADLTLNLILLELKNYLDIGSHSVDIFNFLIFNIGTRHR